MNRAIPKRFNFFDNDTLWGVRESLCEGTITCPESSCDGCIFDAPLDEFAEWLVAVLRERPKHSSGKMHACDDPECAVCGFPT